MKKLFILIVFLTVAAVVFGVFKDSIVKSLVQAGAAQVTGSDVSIGSFSFDLFEQKIRLRNLKIFNPQGFPEEVAIDIPEVTVDYDLPALFKKKLHVPLIVVDLKEVVVVRNKEGKLNVDSFKFVHPDPGGFKPEFEAMEFDVLTLSIGRVVYQDLAKGEDAAVSAYYINLRDKTFRDITGVQKFATLILFEAIKTTAIKTVAVNAVASKLGLSSFVTGIVSQLMSSDEVALDFDQTFEKVYGVCRWIVNSQGTIRQEDKTTGVIKAQVQGADVVVKVSTITRNRVNVKISARKLLIPQPEVAGTLMYAIEGKLR